MGKVLHPTLIDRYFYEDSAREYCRSLPLEHFMESTPQSTQRKITLESFDLIHRQRPDIWCYNELLIQYPLSSEIRDIARVVPDNLIVIHESEIEGTGSFNTPFEEADPFLAMEYVSASNRRKDYVENVNRYQELGLKYYLMFDAEPVKPKGRDVLLYRRNSRGRLVGVRPNEAGRLECPEMEIEFGLLEDWVRFWFRGELIPLPTELADDLESEKRVSMAAKRKAETAERKAETAERKAETAERKAESAERDQKEAEEKAKTERKAREVAEQRAKEMEKENARLKAELDARK